MPVRDEGEAGAPGEGGARALFGEHALGSRADGAQGGARDGGGASPGQGGDPGGAEQGGPSRARGLHVEEARLAGARRPVAWPTGCRAAPGLLVVLDGSRIVGRLARMVEEGRLDPGRLPATVGIDPDPADRGLSQYTPWPHPAYRPGAPAFGGRAEEFLEGEVLPCARAALEAQATGAGPEPDGGAGLDGDGSASDCEAGHDGESGPGGGAAAQGRPGPDGAEAPWGQPGPLGILGYSLAGLFCLDAMMLTDAFSVFLLASPSAWYPGFVNRLARTPLACDPLVALAFGADEGLAHPEPLAGIRQDTDRLVAALTEKASVRPQVATDALDHHRGLDARLAALLEKWPGLASAAMGRMAAQG